MQFVKEFNKTISVLPLMSFLTFAFLVFFNVFFFLQLTNMILKYNKSIFLVHGKKVIVIGEAGLSSNICCACSHVVLYLILVILSRMSVSLFVLRFRNAFAFSFSFLARLTMESSNTSRRSISGTFFHTVESPKSSSHLKYFMVDVIRSLFIKKSSKSSLLFLALSLASSFSSFCLWIL